MRAWTVVLATSLLAGCALGIKEDSSPSVSYTVPHNYQTVYMRAENQGRECQRGESTTKVRSQIDPAMRSGVVSVVDPILGTEVARTALKAIDAKHTEVVQTVSGRGSWNQDALNAMEQSIRMDASVCHVYK
ncbi:BPTD_2524 family lipoprotein [Pusillimonas sp.]|uniref:BPTD_2524 family lipoprotein n=1 Tax=Pusillimonas sp. TaxID=3040095 RepID=UPI0037CAA915